MREGERKEIGNAKKIKCKRSFLQMIVGLSAEQHEFYFDT